MNAHRAAARENIRAVNPPGLRSWPLGKAGVLLCGLAVLVMAAVIVSNHRATSGPSVHLANGPQQVVLPPDKTYGIYVEDANNSGYTESCTATDAQHQAAVRMGGPSWSISSSGTETLDMVYNTGSGDLTINCSVPGETVTTRPVPNYQGLLLGGLAAGILAVLGIILIGEGFTRTRRMPSGPLANHGTW